MERGTDSMNKANYYSRKSCMFTYDFNLDNGADTEMTGSLPVACRDELHSGRRCRERHGSRRRAKTANCISLYRREEELNFRQLAEILGGISWQRAQSLCKAGTASQKAVRALARYEGIPVEEFERRYAMQEENCS